MFIVVRNFAMSLQLLRDPLSLCNFTRSHFILSKVEIDMVTSQFIIMLFSNLILMNTTMASKWVVVVTVSEWYDEIFQNWLIWYKSLDLGMETIVIAEDSFTYEKYNNSSDFTLLQFKMDEVRFNSKILENKFLSGLWSII